MFIIGDIREYDMRAAGPNALLAENLISKHQYDLFMNITDKHKRQVELGYFIKNNGLIEKRSEAIKKYVNLFISTNQIPADKILEIATDAIWVKDHKCDILEFSTPYNTVVFRRDREATSMLSYKRNNFYYDSWSGNFHMRGFNGTNEFTDSIKQLMSSLENSASNETIYHLVHGINLKFLRKELLFKTENTTKDLVNYLIETLIE